MKTTDLREKVLGFLGAQLLRLLNATLSWEKAGLDPRGEHWSYGEPIILAFWHSDQLMGPWTYLGFSPPENDRGRKRRTVSALISQHSDGRLIASAMSFLGIENVAGSSTRGGARAFVQMKRAIEDEGSHITITPDGPKGPPREAKVGAVSLSAHTGAPILPVGIAFERCWRARSWDEMLIPKPFSRARMVAGPLLQIPKGVQGEELVHHQEQLTAALNEAKSRAEEPFRTDGSVGRGGERPHFRLKGE
ncbi:lysophospholipid acyltransferase family protein [bacterium]|nr:lysophospholipid acyltransferase family protein [bacterium]